MMILYALIIPTIIVCSFLLFVLARHDFAILRRNITLVQIFDKVFIATVFGVVVARVVYILNSGELYLFHLLAFFHLLRNSGFSIFGFYCGLIGASLLLFRNSKIVMKMLDIIMLSFFPLMFLNVFISTFVMKNILINGGVAIGLFVIYVVLLTLVRNAKTRDGFIANVLLIIICVVSFIANIIIPNKLISILSFSQVCAIVVSVLALIQIILIHMVKKKK